MRIRSMLIPIVTLVFLAGCGSDEKTPTAPANHDPVISQVQISFNPLPLNKTATLRVVATDADHDRLTYQWTATGGSFPDGSSGSTATWKPPATKGYYDISITVSDGTGTAKMTVRIEVIDPVE